MNGLFAYGSLINSASRRISLPATKAFPVEVLGERRGWYAPILGSGATGLGLVQDADSRCNGVIIHISKEQLNSVDDRELPHGYERVELPADRILVERESALPNGPIWTYRNHQHALPTKDLPIIQSYVDVVLKGCFSIDLAFAERFVDTTDGWSAPWVNDRKTPRYLRAAPNAANERAVDELLARRQATAFAERQAT
jgi:hypothetical protein